MSQERFTVEIELGNDAMQNGEDVANALVEMAADLRIGQESGVVRDFNGNTVGRWAFDGPSAERDPYES
jgi:hypothetical protein